MPRLSTNYQAILRAYTESPRVNSVSIGAEALFVRLVCLSDGAGRYYGDPFDICARACTTRMKNGLSPDDVADWLSELLLADLVSAYEVLGQPYLLVNRYHDAGNKAKEEFPPPPYPAGEEQPPAGDTDHSAGAKKPPSRKKKGRKKKPAPLKGDSRARITNTNTNNNTNTKHQQVTPSGARAGAEPLLGDRGESVDSSGPTQEAKDLAQHLAFTHLVPLGVPHGDIPELLEQLQSPRWAGGHTRDDCEAAARTLALRSRGTQDPGAEILQAVRTESAAEGGLVVAETGLSARVLHAGGGFDSTPGQEPGASTGAHREPDVDERKGAHHLTYAKQLEDQAAAIERSRPGEAQALRHTANNHRAAAKRLDGKVAGTL